MLPKRRHTKGRTGRKYSHQALGACNLSRCPQCSNPKRPHAACGNCGYVNPSITIPIKEKSSS